MNDNVKNELELVIDTLMRQLMNNNDRLTLCAMSTAQFINYFISKGIFLESEKKECARYVCSYIDNKYFASMQNPNWVLNGLVDMMMAEASFNYECLIFPITTLMIKK